MKEKVVLKWVIKGWKHVNLKIKIISAYFEEN